MNYLGHLYLSKNRLDIMRSNLFGDFVKGSHFEHFPMTVQDGIILHRKIDDYIDRHPAVLELLHVLYPRLPKVAGIAVDLYFDHILARDWEFYSDLTLTDFTLNFFNYEDKNEGYFSKEFKDLLRIIEEGKWLLNYEYIDGLEFACKGLSSRISFENELKNGVNVFHENKELIETTFKVFMKDAIKKFN